MKKIIVCAWAILIATTCTAQKYYGVVSYATTLPANNTKDFADQFSFRGAGIEFGFIKTAPDNLDDLFSVGISGGWYVINEERLDVTETMDNVTLQGNQYRYVNIFPFLVNGRYHLINESIVKPFVGFGIGTYFIERRNSFGGINIETEEWHFGIAPEIGTVINVNKQTGIIISGRYNAAFEAGNQESQSFWNINLGVRFTELNF